MGVEEDIKSLKQERSTLRAKVTTAANILHNAITQDKDIEELSHLYDNVQQMYNDFTICHLAYEEAVHTDDKYESYRTVNNLDLDSYCKSVADIHDKALACLVERKKSQQKREVTTFVSKAKIVLGDLQAIIDKDEITKAPDVCVLLDNAFDVLSVSSRLLDRFSNVTSGDNSLYDSLQTCHLDLDVNCRKVKQLLSASEQRERQHSEHSGRYRDSQIRVTSLPGDHTRAPLTATNVQRDVQTPSLPESRPVDSVHVPQSPLKSLSVVSAYNGTSEHYNLNSPIHTSQIHASSQNVEPPLHSGPLHSSHTQSSRFIKAPPPTFSGNRVEWPEFRAIWKKYGDREFPNDEERAWALKGCLKGPALEYVKAIFVTQPNAYNRIWDRLDHVYNDISHSIQATFSQMHELKAVSEHDLHTLIHFVNEIELCYSRLGEIGQLSAVTLNQIDSLCDLLPISMRKEWNKLYRQLPTQMQIHPFSPFMEYLEGERNDSLRLAERSGNKTAGSHKLTDSAKTTSNHHTQISEKENLNTEQNPERSKSNCAIHDKPGVKHTTESCRNFLSMETNGKYELLKKAKLCFRCLKRHKKNECKASNCSKCGRSNHHELLCRDSQSRTANDQTHSESRSNDNTSQKSSSAASNSANANNRSTSLFPIIEAQVRSSSKTVQIMFDTGSDCSYIMHKSAEKLKATKLGQVTLDVVTMGGATTKYTTNQYELPLITTNGQITHVKIYGMDQITGPVAKLDEAVIKGLFPYFDSSSLQRKSASVDILLGNDYYGLHPKRELAKSGEHLSIMEGDLGICLQGTHQQLTESTELTSNVVGMQNVIGIDRVAHSNHAFASLRMNADVTSHANYTKGDSAAITSFIHGEEMGTEVTPKCGGCKCSKCPIVGHTYSFKEQQELDLIRENLQYDRNNERWVTKYPWIQDPSTLPNNYNSAIATLKNCEKSLQRDGSWAKVYGEQIEEMVTRGVAKKLSEDDIENWHGPVFYISHLAVKNPKSKTTPVRIVFNSSQTYQGVSLNSMLAKGPDAYLNNIIGILLRWRECKTAFVGDIRKMFNSIFIQEVEQHCHRFLWRDLETGRKPDVYVIQRVNMGDKPAGAISTEAIYQTATLFEQKYPEVAEVLRHSTYVDDIVDSTSGPAEAFSLTDNVEAVLSKAGFKVKSWQFTGGPMAKTELSQTDEQDEQTTRVLGLLWKPKEDQILISSRLNFSPKKKGQYTLEDITPETILTSIPLQLTKRSVLEQVMKIHDPLGFVSPFTLQAKCYLRETWAQDLKWDDPLPMELRTKWIAFFEQSLMLQSHSFDRCLKPDNASGQPSLILFSDGSETAYGFAAYIRWELDNGQYHCRLICSKSRIAPMKRRSIPQMELNAAVLSKRARQLLEKEMRFDFKQTVHLIDSETVLSMLNKVSTRFKPYEGVRVGEIQGATSGDMTSWFWVAGKANIADWLTRPKSLSELNKESEWWKGPQFLYQEMDTWDIRPSKTYTTEQCSEEHTALTTTITNKPAQPALIDYKRFSRAEKLLWVVARIKSALKHKSFKGGQIKNVTTETIEQTRKILLQDVQSTMIDLTNGDKGKYKQLKPVQTNENLWVVGGRLSLHNPYTGDAPQWLLPSNHDYTRLLMKEAHERGGHRGRDGTLARFRQAYWTPQGAKVAKAVKNACQLCRVRDAKLLTQEMGLLPLERLQRSPPFNNTMVDLFGPYLVRGEVQKRTSGKAYGVIFTDMYSRAVHIEVVYGYDTQSFLLALIRFASIRGWPAKIFSDPGSQLVGAEKEIVENWNEMNKDDIYKLSCSRGTQWVFGPPDSPWQQGLVESMVKGAKRCLKLAINTQRVSSSQLSTICSEVSNMLNERPLGTLPSAEGEINILTPNCLLLGRSQAANPGGWVANTSLRAQLALVNDIANNFWQHWKECYAPTLMRQQKWHKPSKNLQVGDVVAVTDQNSLRSSYYIARISETFPSKDGKVRKVALTYKNFRKGEKAYVYKGAGDTRIIRSVQRLALLVPLDGQAVGSLGGEVSG